MKRWIFNLCALAVVGLGGSSLLHATVNPDPFCCSQGALSCCGPKGCEIAGSGCSAW